MCDDAAAMKTSNGPLQETVTRSARRRSFAAQRLHRFHSRCMARGNCDRSDRRSYKDRCRSEITHRVARPDAEEQRGHDAPKRDRESQAKAQTGYREPRPLSEEVNEYVSRRRPQCHADADLVDPLVDHISAVLGRDQVQIRLAENGGDSTQDGCAFHVKDLESLFAEFKAYGERQAGESGGGRRMRAS